MRIGPPAVVSPFTRTLQTACHLLGDDIGAPVVCADNAALPARAHDGNQLLPTLVQPLCAERTDVLSHMGRGNRGSTADELANMSNSRPEIGSALPYIPPTSFSLHKKLKE